MAVINGNTVGNVKPRSDWDEKNPQSGAYIGGKKPTIHKESDGNHSDDPLLMGNKKITGLGDGTAPGDAVNVKTAESLAQAAAKTAVNGAEKSVQVTLTVGGWTGSHEQEVSVAGVTANNIVLYSTDPSTRTAYMESDVYLASQSAGKLKFKWGESKPEVNLKVNIVVRVGA